MDITFFKIAVCDDERSEIDHICLLLKEFSDQYNISISIDRFTEYNKLLIATPIYDILFLDIELDGGSGLDIGKQLRQYNSKCNIVYITSYSNYRDIAFSIHAFDYIVKPLTQEKLFQIMEDVLRSIPFSNDKSLRLIFNLKEGIFSFAIDEIHYLEYRERKVFLHTIKNKEISFSNKTMSEIATILHPHYFEMPHKSFVVNLSHVQYVKKNTIFMLNDIKIPMSQKYAPHFRKQLNSYIRGKIVV